VSDDVVQVEPDYEGIAEEWERLTDEPDIRGVSAAKRDRIDGWVVDVYVQQVYPEDDPLGAELRQLIQGALRSVDGVVDVHKRDSDSWRVTGAPSVEALTRAAARVVDDMFERLNPDD
jgi:hypothetical protein